jgi:hypothetical protein
LPDLKPVKLLPVRVLVNLILFLAIFAVIAWWFRGYWPGLRRSYQRLRDTVRVISKARAVVRDVRSGRVNPQDFMRDVGTARSQRGGDAKTVDVTPAGFKVVCPACGDSLSEAQTNALRMRGVRCPGSSRVGRECPYYGHSLN